MPPIFVPPAQIVYAGLHWACKLFVALTLTWAVVPTPRIAAVWIGAQNPAATRWVQAGIYSSDHTTRLYVEWNRGGGATRHSRRWKLTERAHARLEHRGNMWRAGIGTFWTPWLRFEHVRRCTTLELVGNAHAAAIVSGHVIAG